MKQEFVHLHVHSEYSLLDGACRLNELTAAVAAQGQSAVALTDHGNLYGAVAFWRSAKANGIKPIIGCEVYVAQRSRHSKQGKNDMGGYHLVLLVENEVGYYNLMQLVSLGNTEGFYSKPRVDMELLGRYHEGLIALSACLSGYIPSMILEGQYEQAKTYALQMQDLFGKQSFYLELQDHGLADDKRVCAALRRISAETSIPMVVTNDVHYINKKDAHLQKMLMCIQTNSTYTDPDAPVLPTNEFYLKTPEDMSTLFPGDKEALLETVRIAERCQFDFTFGKVYLPTFPPHAGETHEQTLKRETETGFVSKVRAGKITFSSAHSEEQYRTRMNYELSVISKMGYTEYFLIVQDFVRYAKTHGIPVGPGRGSGASSLVAYCLSITDVDPLQYDLLFERFLNPERITLPDFDIDLCYERRDQIIDYVKRKYGEDHVAQIITFGTLQAKAAIRDVGRAMGVSYAETDRVANLIPALGVSIREAMAIPAFKAMHESADYIADMIDTAMALEGMPRHISVHAAGVVITEKPVSDYVPKAMSGDAVVAAYDMNTVADLGLVKFDFLGLRYLTVLDHAEKFVQEEDPMFQLERVPFDDPDTYALLKRGDTDGVFQLESAGIRNVLRHLKPDRLGDIIACIALYRPGPMDSIDTFIARKSGAEKTEYLAHQLKPILDDTYGCIVYQEQVMQIFRELAGYSYAKADQVRRAMSKKKADMLEAERDSFLLGAKAKGISDQVAGAIFDDMASFAKYAFNKSHATAYAFLSYRTAYMKVHYPAAYTAALLNAQQNTDPAKCPVRILPPHINESRLGFAVSGKDVRFGLVSIKNVGQLLAEAIVKERQQKPFADFSDFLERIPSHTLNKRSLLALIQSGCFDCFGVSRRALISVYEKMLEEAHKRQRNSASGQLDMFSIDLPTISGLTEKPSYPSVAEYPRRELIRMEKEVTGICFSGNLMDSYSAHIAKLKPTEIQAIVNRNIALHNRQALTICGIITSKTVKRTKSGTSMAFLRIEDSSAIMEVIVFPTQYEKYIEWLEENRAVGVMGQIELRDSETPRLVLTSVLDLVENQEQPKVKDEMQQKMEPRLCLKLPSLSCSEATATIALLHTQRGNLPVIFYDTSKRKYVKANGCETKYSKRLDTKLKEILGEQSVFWQNMES